MRKFIRHPSDIPIECRLQDNESSKNCCINNISIGGLSFAHDTYIKPKSIVHITIAASEPAFETDAMIVWCNKNKDSYDIGVKFESDATEFSMRMVEQICHIEHYRNEVLAKEGRQLSSEEAAKEWIARYAENFPF